MTHKSTRHTPAAEAAKILADVKDRVEQLEQDDAGSDDQVQLFRSVTNTVTTSDSHTVTEQTPGFVFGTDTWGFAEFDDK